MAGLSSFLTLAVVLGAVLLLRDGSFEAPTGDSSDVRSVQPGAAAGALARLEQAVRDGDIPAAEGLAASGDEEARGWLRALVANAAATRIVDFSLRYVDEVGGTGPGSVWSAAVETSWRFEGFDDSAARAEVAFQFVTDDGEVSIASVGGHDRRTPVWMSGPVEVRRSPETLVVAAAPAEVADEYARLATAAVPVVRTVLAGWKPRLVVEVPGSSALLDAALAAPEGEYARIAAVTATVDGALTQNAPMHVFVNPKVFGALKPDGAQVVMSHEATHVATLAASSAVPPWLLEGFADYVALRDVDLPLRTTARQIAEQVRRDGLPDDLPGPAEFATSTTHLGAAYEAAWLACVELAERGGEAALVTLYERVRDGADADRAIRKIFGLDRDAFVERWRARLAALP